MEATVATTHDVPVGDCEKHDCCEPYDCVKQYRNSAARYAKLAASHESMANMLEQHEDVRKTFNDMNNQENIW